MHDCTIYMIFCIVQCCEPTTLMPVFFLVLLYSISNLLNGKVSNTNRTEDN